MAAEESAACVMDGKPPRDLWPGGFPLSSYDGNSIPTVAQKGEILSRCVSLRVLLNWTPKGSLRVVR